jgi:deazaflavin-dependent oxidoreductase (nitroreductase family)
LLYRANLGWLLGRRFVQLTVRGRRSGLPRRVVLEVIGGSLPTGDLLIASAWGQKAQWFRNVMADPEVRVRVGRLSFAAKVALLSESAGAEALCQYARAHPLAYNWFIGPLVLGQRPAGTSTEFAALAGILPILAVRAERSG